MDKLQYPPQGHRGVFGSAPHVDFKSVPSAELTAAFNKTNLIVVMLESPKAIDNAAAIAAVPGIDSLLIGTNDLCVELGIPGELGHERVVDAYARTIAACKAQRKWAGMGGVYDDALMRRYIDMGCRFILGGADLAFMLGGATRRVGFLRELKPA